MRIAMLVEASGGGTGKHVTDLAAQLLARGHEVHVLYSPVRADLAFLTRTTELTGQRGFTAFPLPIRHQVHISDVNAVRAVCSYLGQHGPFDALHCHSTKAGLIGRIAGRLAGVRSVYTPHAILTIDPGLGRMRRVLVTALERVLSGVTDRIIAVSDAEDRHMCELGIARSRITVVPNGIATSRDSAEQRAEVRASLGLDPSHTCIGFVGRLAPQKSLHTLLEAFASIRGSATDARLVVVGSGPLAAAHRELAEKCKIADQVIWCGERNGAEIMPAFDILAVPSLFESFPYVVLEAMAAGLPVVATDVGGLSMMVESGTNGILVPPGDTGSMAGALRLLLNNEDLRQRMGQHSLLRVQRFSMAGMVDAIVSCYAPVSNDVAQRVAA